MPFLNYLINDLFFFGLYNVLYAGYLELSPGIGKVIIRKNNKGNNVISLASFLHFAKQPLNFENKQIIKHFWSPKNLDINYVFVMTSSMILHKLLYPL